MPPTLRKACHACATAKRRCIPELPQCSRCAERRLTCTYDLEPVTNHQHESLPRQAGQPRTVFPHAWEPLPSIVFDSVASAHEAAVNSFPHLRHEALPVMANPEILSLVTQHFLRPMPHLILQKQTTPFVHAQILQAMPPEVHVVDLGLQPQLLKQLTSLDVQYMEFPSFLAAFHILVALLLTLMLDEKRQAHHGGDTARLFSLWSKWRHQLHKKLPRTLSGGLSAWQAWCIAESARRSLLCVILVDGIIELAEKGYCSYRAMIESLPFDARTGLWEASSEEEWLCALSKHGGTESDLISWSEFIESGGPEPRQKYDGLLQRMLLVIHFGKAAADLEPIPHMG